MDTQPISQAITTQSNVPALPTEIWLIIFEHWLIPARADLWCSVRRVCRKFRDLVERLYILNIVPGISISLALPRHDPTTQAFRWPGPPIPHTRINLSFDRMDLDQRRIHITSPTAVKDRSMSTTWKELKESDTVPRERLVKSIPWVFFDKVMWLGCNVEVPRRIEWDEEREVWSWDADWRCLITGFYKAKAERRQKLQTNIKSKQAATKELSKKD